MTTHERDAAYDALAGPAAALYRQLGFGPLSWFDADALAVLTDLDAATGERLAETLVDVGLVDAVDDGFALSPDGHLHARIKAEQCEADEHELNSAGLDRLFAFLNDAAGEAERLITPSHRALWEREAVAEPSAEPPFPLEEEAALDWLEERLPVYMDAIRFSFGDRRYALACDLAHRLWPLWLRRRHPAQRAEALTLGLAAATLLQSDSAIGQMLTTLAGTLRGTSPVSAHEYNRRAAEHYQQTGDTVGLAQALNGLGKSALSAGQLDQAEQHFGYAEQLHSGLGYVREAALSRQGRGLVAIARGDADAADDLLGAAYQVLFGVGDSYDAALALAHHAEALAALGEIDGAMVELGMALEALTRASSAYGQAIALEIKARIMISAGLSEQAEAVANQALALFDRTDQPSAARVHGMIAALPTR